MSTELKLAAKHIRALRIIAEREASGEYVFVQKPGMHYLRWDTLGDLTHAKLIRSTGMPGASSVRVYVLTDAGRTALAEVTP